MKLLATIVLLMLLPGARAQSMLDDMLQMAQVKSVLEIDTPAGRTRAMVLSPVADPQFVFLYAAGGAGNVDIGTNFQGEPTSADAFSLAFRFGPAFLKKQAAWAVVGVPQNYGVTIPEQRRLEPEHVEAVAQVARRIRQDFPKSKLILIGHSNGGVTAGMQAIQPAPAVDAVVMSAPNLKWLPFRWSTRAQVPLLFITHKEDACPSTAAYLTVSAAGSKFPLSVIDSPSPGRRDECLRPPGPHFFSGTYTEYTEAVLRWAMSL